MPSLANQEDIAFWTKLLTQASLQNLSALLAVRTFAFARSLSFCLLVRGFGGLSDTHDDVKYILQEN